MILFRFDFRAHGKSDGKDIEMTMEGLKKRLRSDFMVSSK